MAACPVRGAYDSGASSRAGMRSRPRALIAAPPSSAANVPVSVAWSRGSVGVLEIDSTLRSARGSDPAAAGPAQAAGSGGSGAGAGPGGAGAGGAGCGAGTSGPGTGGVWTRKLIADLATRAPGAG